VFFASVRNKKHAIETIIKGIITRTTGFLKKLKLAISEEIAIKIRSAGDLFKLFLSHVN